jgi:hypothetical protein
MSLFARACRGPWLALLAAFWLAILSGSASFSKDLDVYRALTQVDRWLNTARPLTPEDLKGKADSRRFLDVRLHQLPAPDPRPAGVGEEVRRPADGNRRAFGEVRR